MSSESSSNNRYSRRQFLKTTALSGMAAGPFILNGCTDDSQSAPKQQGEAKNIIFMVSDGMSTGTLNMADMLKHRLSGERSQWLKLYNSDRHFHRGLMDMASLNSLVTDSAAAGSSWGSGHRVNNGAINVGPDGESYRPIHQIFRDAGKKTGLVTTTRITHATPAAFAVNIRDRNQEDRIAELYLEEKFDLLMGGGSRHFTAERRTDERDLLQQFADHQYQIVRNKQDLSAASLDQPLLGLFHDGHLPFDIDRTAIDRYRNTIPSLSAMTRNALNHLDNKEGFILQVEGGRVDHGAHNNDATAMLYDQLAFDEALEVALNYTEKRDDTLLVITTDHGNGNPGLNGAGPSYKYTNKQFDKMQKMRYSNDWILSELTGDSSTATIRDRVKEATDIGINQEEADALRQSLNGRLDTLYDIQDSPDSVLGSILANYTSINFTSGNHTSDYIELAAAGPGVQNLDPFTRNTDIFDFLLNAAGLEVGKVGTT